MAVAKEGKVRYPGPYCQIFFVYGFPEISEIGASLERAGTQQDEAKARRHIKRLEIYLKTIIGAE